MPTLFVIIALFLIVYGYQVAAFQRLQRFLHRRIALQAVLEIKSIADFEAFVTKPASTGNGLPIVVDFQKSNCRPCAKAIPIFNSLSEKFDGKAIFCKVDADSWDGALQLMRANGVKSVPTFQIWQRGSKLHSVQGAKVLDDLENLLNQL